MKLSHLILSILALSITARSLACDLCGCYKPQLEVSHAFPFYAGASEQFTHFGTDRLDGKKVHNPTGQYLDSSNTQIVVGAPFFNNRLGIQLNLPLISRSFKRPQGFDIQHGTESGLGDVSLLANYVVFRKAALFSETGGGLAKDGKTSRQRGEPDLTATLNLTAGLKFPTGDSRRIKEEFHEVEVEGAPKSGIHGHDLALGTGSIDGVFGAQFFARYKAVFLQADAQFTWRGPGRYTYRYANDFSWSGGPGVYLFRRGSNSLGLQCALSGETKGTDTFRGESATDTGVTSLYIGPRVIASFGRVAGEIGVDLPVLMNTTSFQTTPDYRIRAGLTIRF